MIIPILLIIIIKIAMIHYIHIKNWKMFTDHHNTSAKMYIQRQQCGARGSFHPTRH